MKPAGECLLIVLIRLHRDDSGPQPQEHVGLRPFVRADVEDQRTRAEPVRTRR